MDPDLVRRYIAQGRMPNMAKLAAYLLAKSINGPLQETSSVIASSAAQILAATTEQAAGTNESMAAVRAHRSDGENLEAGAY